MSTTETPTLSAKETLRSAVKVLLSDACDVLHKSSSFHDKRVLLRADFNVPVVNGIVVDTTRITALMPTLKMLLAHGAKVENVLTADAAKMLCLEVVIASHLGRPNPAKQSWDEMERDASLAPVAAVLEGLLAQGSFTGLAPDCVGERAEAAVNDLQPGQAVLLQNTRMHAGDTANDPQFAAQLARLADVYVCDAFGVIHRDQASVTGVIRHVDESYPGPLVRHELEYLGAALDEPKRPLGVVVGGAKVADKISVLWALIDKADVVVVGGRMAFTLLAAQGVSVGATQIEEQWLQPAREMIATAAAKGVKLILPCDVLVSPSLDGPAADPIIPPKSAESCCIDSNQSKCGGGSAQLPQACCTGNGSGSSCCGGLASTYVVGLSVGCCGPDAPCIPAGKYGVDIGPATAAAIAEELAGCSTIFWNGPMGKFEVPEFSRGTVAVAKAVVAATARGAVTVVGGGDSVAAINALGLSSQITHVSTGGGASLELVEGKGMPGVRALAAAALAQCR